MPRLFLGNLGNDCRQRDIERLFQDYGELRNINIKGQYGFLEIDEKNDAADAIKDINGKTFNSGRIRVEYANAYVGNESRDRGSDSRVGRYRRTNYRLVVENLSHRTSWQDLKDFMKKAGDITYTTVNRGVSGEGLVEFADRDGMEYALRELDDTKLDGQRIRLVDERKSRSRSRSRSRGRGRKSPSRSRSRGDKRPARRERSRRSYSKSPRSGYESDRA